MRLANGRTAALLALPLLAACAGDYAQSSLAPVTDFADTIHGLYTSVFWWTMLILAVVWIAMAVTLIKFRDRPGAPEPRQIHGHLGLEIGWTIGPALIVVAIAIPTIRTVFATQVPEDPEDRYVVDVVGHQFWWEFRYPEGVVTANELHLPVGKPISLRLHSADVIHSFWIPQIGGKRDVNPLVVLPAGEEPRYNWLYFTVEKPGTYRGQCAEFCGPSHSLMGVRVVAQSEDDFRAWEKDWYGGTFPDSVAAQLGEPMAAAPADTAAPAAAQPSPPATGQAEAQMAQAAPARDPMVARGDSLFHNNICIACHTIRGTTAQGVVAPNLTMVGRRTTIAAGWLENTPENLAEWITSPHSVKPGSLMPGVAEPGGGWPATNLTPDQVKAVAAYLTSLR